LDKYQGQAYEDEVAKGKAAIEAYSWANVAKAWDAKIDGMFQERFDKNKQKIIDNLVYHSDLVAAWKLTGEQKYRDMLDKAEHDNMSSSDFCDWNTEEDRYLNGRGATLLKLVENILYDDPMRKLNILDLGSNDGILSMPIMKRFSTSIESLTMYDGSQAVLDHLKKNYQEKYPNINYVCDNVINVTNYDFKPDIVIIGELLEHIEPTIEFLNMLMKLANENTLFYFTVPRGPWEFMKKDNTEIHHVHHFELNDIKTIFSNVNLNLATANVKVKGRRGEPCDNWLFWFNASKDDVIEFNEVDYNDKWIKSRPYKSISCCMIVKNEEDNLSRCLKTVTDFADEIIIVDTGSTDDTKRIAHKFTDKVYDLKWEEEDGLGNFARARNYSVDKASGDFIFWIDADEQLESGEALYKFINSDYYDGCLLKQKQCMSKQSHDMGINVDVMHDRLFKRGSIRFTGVIHEYPSKNDHDFLGDKMFWQDYAWVLHYGLANQNTLKKKSIGRNANLIYKNVERYPNKIFAKHYILVDYWSQFITGHPNPDLRLLEQGLNYWHEVLEPCGDDWTIRLSIGVVQHFYSYCAVNGLAYKGKLPEKVAFQNPNTNEVIDFYVLHPETETDLFFKYLSTFQRTV
jgi:glycosyltransferase involved in cell wall biosynthesis/2-polyprenyl-3-methyl-5-hydroxy-6-metoxy-1,4-benzoquinol methylase